MRKDIDDLYQNSFCNNDENKQVDHLRSTHIKGLLDSVKKNIPQRTTSRRWNLQYVTTKIKQLINTKKKLYNKAKKTQSESDWSRFKKVRKYFKSKLREAHHNYISDILDLGISGRTRISTETHYRQKVMGLHQGTKEGHCGDTTTEGWTERHHR